MSDSRILLLDPSGIPIASLDPHKVLESAQQLMRELVEACEDESAAAAVIIQNEKAEGDAANVVRATAALLLTARLADLGRRLQQATGTEASLQQLILGEEG